MPIPPGYNVQINGVSVQVLEGSFQATDAISTVSTVMFKVRDDLGTSHFTKGMPVSISSVQHGLSYTGFVSAAVEDRVSPNTLIFTDIGARDNHTLAEKRTYDGVELTNQYAIVALCELLNVLSQEGIVSQYAIERDTTAIDFSTGTLTGVVGTSNVGDGDLELTQAGTTVTNTQNSTGQFSAGSMTSIDARNNQINLHASNVIKFTGTLSIAGLHGFVYWKIWSGSYAIASGNFLEYDVWISSTSPAMTAGVDFVCTDGTSMKNFSSPQLFDQYGILAHPQNSLSGFANDQWYHRKIDVSAMAGKTISYATIAFDNPGGSAGNYQAYFRNMFITNGQFIGAANLATFYDSTTHPYDPQNAPLNQNSLAGGTDFANVTTSIITAYDQSGTWTSSAINVNAAKVVGTASVQWSSVIPTGVTPATATSGSTAPLTPAGTTIMVNTSIDSQITWQALTSPGAIPDLEAGMNIAGRSLYEQVVLAITGTTPEISPAISALMLQITSAYSGSTTNSLTSYQAVSDFNTGTNSGTKNWQYNPNSIAGNVTLDGMFYNWFQAPIVNQTLFGSTAPSQANIQRQLRLATNSGTDVRSRLENYDGGDNSFQNFTCSVMVQIPTGSTSGNIGIVYRTTGWVNGNNSFAYTAYLDTSGVTLGRGTNGGASTFTSIATSAVALTNGNWYNLTVIVNGSNHQVLVDGVVYINATDATYAAAGQIGLRLYNNTGGALSGFFQNFGVIVTSPGTWISPSIVLTALGTIGNSAIFWNATVPNGCTLLCESTINGGVSWQTVAQGGQIGNAPPGTSVSGVSVQLRFTFTSPNASVTPVLSSLSIWATSQITASGNRISPVLSLANVGRLGGSVVAWNATLPSGCTLGVDTRIDSGAWTDVTSNPGGPVPGLTAQVVPALDSFDSNTSANYTNTFMTGGAAGTWTYDTANSRLISPGGTNAAFLYNALIFSDGSVECDMDWANIAGPVLRWVDANNCYFLKISDDQGTNPQTIQLFKNNGGLAQIGSTASISFLRGTYHRVHFEIAGTSILVNFDGVQVISATDSSIAGPGKAGLYQNTKGQFYSIRVQPFGQDVTSHTIQTRLRLASTNPLATPQVLDAALVAFGTNLSQGALIPQTAMYHKYCDKNIDDLAKASSTLSGATWWYIDKNKVPYFLPTSALPAPWPASDGGVPVNGSVPQGDFLDANITVEDSSDLYRNRSIIDNVLAPTTINQTQIGDGASTSWTFASQWAGAPTILVNGVIASVGIQNVDTGKQFYYAVGSPTITEDKSGPVYDFTTTLIFSGPGQYLTYSQANNLTEQAAMQALQPGTSGIFCIIEDGTGLTKAQGDALAQARINQYSVRGKLLKATTRRFGLAPGQLLTVFLPSHKLFDTQMLIRQVTTTLTTEFGIQQGWYAIEAVSGPDVGDWTKLYQRPAIDVLPNPTTQGTTGGPAGSNPGVYGTAIYANARYN